MAASQTQKLIFDKNIGLKLFIKKIIADKKLSNKKLLLKFAIYLFCSFREIVHTDFVNIVLRKMRLNF